MTAKPPKKDPQGHPWKRLGNVPSTTKNGDRGRPFLDRDGKPWCAKCGIEPTKSTRAPYCTGCRTDATAATRSKYRDKAPRRRTLNVKAHHKAASAVKAGTPFAVVTGGVYISTATLDQIKEVWAPVATSIADTDPTLWHWAGGRLSAQEEQVLLDAWALVVKANRVLKPLLVLDPKTTTREPPRKTASPQDQTPT